MISRSANCRSSLVLLCRKLTEEHKAEGEVPLKQLLKALTNKAQLRVILSARQRTALYDGGSHLCYHVMCLVHSFWAPVPGGIKDYIATPKSNGYRVRQL